MLSAKKYPIYSFAVAAADALAIFLGFSLAYWIRFSGFLFATKQMHHYGNYLRLIGIAVPLYLLIFRSYRLYQPERHIRRVQELLNIAKAITAATVILWAITFVYREFVYSRFALFGAWLAVIVICCSFRYFLIQLEYLIRKKQDRDRVLVVGVNRSARDLIKWARANPHYGQQVIGVLAQEPDNEGKHLEDAPILGSYDSFVSIVEAGNIDEVVIADSSIPKNKITEFILKCESRMIGFKLVADFYGLVTHYVDVEYISNVPLLGLKALPLDDPWNRWTKRGFDFAVAGVALIVLLPLFFVIAALVKLSGPGPVFYRQERVGRDEKHFQLLKFRTMQSNAEEASGPIWAKQNDERVTPIGKLLRRLNLDELPQLWNVLVGEMSLIGPRPERPHFVEQFRDQIPHYMARHKIKSGITGWAQIHGLRGNTSLEERIKYDLYYMENWTLMMDIEILILTVFAFKNAY